MKPTILFLCTLFFGISTALAAEPIRIGVAGSFSGDLAPYGIPPKNAVMLAAEQQNQKGGVLGRPIEIVALDDVCKPEAATNVANRMVQEKVVAVIGHICSGATNAAMPIYNSARLLVISPSATSPELTLAGKNPFFFRTIPHDAAQAMIQADFITKHLKAKKVAVVHDKGDYGRGLATLVKAELEKRGVEIVIFEGVTPGAADYSALIHKIKRAKPDVVAFGGYHPEGSKIVTQARKKSITVPFISGDGLKDPSFIKIGQQYVEGYYVSSPADITQLPLTQEVTKNLKARNQEPGNFGLQAHAAFHALIQAMESTQGTQPEALKKALQSNKVKTTLGEISFDAAGDVVGAGFSIYQVQKGVFVPIPW